MCLVKVTKNRGRNSTWVCPLGAARVAVIYLTFMTLKPKSSRLLDTSSAGVQGGKVMDYCVCRLFRIWEEDKIVEIIFFQLGFHG
jgi:hypothetical protein